MPKIFVSFEGDTVSQLHDQMIAFLLAPPPSTWAERQAAGLVEAPSDPEEAADAEIPDAEWDAKHSPSPKPKRSSRKLAELTGENKQFPLDGGGEIELAVVTEYKPEPAPKPAVEPPPLDVLKARVTTAVKEAQKNGSGASAILTLLPAFKAETGLDFIANAKEEHRDALFRLVEAAGLTV